VIALVAKRSK